jgi:glycerophosphoryl diester phosphodiesterase
MNKQNSLTRVFGHRGSAGTHPENTMAAFEEAARVGAEGIEFDIQLSKDGIPVIIHDETLDRTTDGNGWVKDFTFDELQRLDAGSWFDGQFRGVQIPSLEEVLDWATGNSLLLNLELKTGLVRYPQIEEKVIRLVDQYSLTERVIISSFNHYSLVEVRNIHSDIETAILFMEGIFEPWKYAGSIGAKGLHCHWPIATVPEIMEGAQKAGSPVRPFTVNKEEHMRLFFQNGCSGIFTDWPKLALEFRAEMAKT